VRLHADYIAISFPRDGADIDEARRLVQEAGGHAGIVAKIERAEAVDNLEDIMSASDVVMVARGDLGVEIGDAAVPPVQKRIMRLAPKHNCPVIVATQMMESMISNPIPTRAEVNDVANAALDGADAVMLSGESAAGKYPVEAVQAMHRTCIETERQNVLPSAATRELRHPQSVDECIARKAMETASTMSIKAIAAFTQSGNTALFMSRSLGAVPVYALTPETDTLGRVALYRNVIPKVLPGHYTEATDAPRATTEVLAMMHKDGLVNKGDMIVMTMGTPMGQAGSTNTMKLVRVD
jgi:pyruvate kinase